MKVKKKQYLKILEYFLRSIKKRICKTEKFKFFKYISINKEGLLTSLLTFYILWFAN